MAEFHWHDTFPLYGDNTKYIKFMFRRMLDYERECVPYYRNCPVDDYYDFLNKLQEYAERVLIP